MALSRVLNARMVGLKSESEISTDLNVNFVNVYNNFHIPRTIFEMDHGIVTQEQILVKVPFEGCECGEIKFRVIF